MRSIQPPRELAAKKRKNMKGELCRSRVDLIFWGLAREDDWPMSRRDLSQRSFVDAMMSGWGKGGGFLDRIEQAFDWSAFEALLSPIHASSRGAPGYPPLVMFKILLLQQWHTRSDPGAEEAVRDRLSFRRFCGLPLEAETPDHASIWRFRQTIDKLGLWRLCFPRRTVSSMGSASSLSAGRWWTRP
jgi:Transposase domain (DUF772)